VGTWGVGLYQGQVYLSYICAFIPFSSNWTGVKILSHDGCTMNTQEQTTDKMEFSIYPNPAINKIYINNLQEKALRVQIFNTLGQLCLDDKVDEKKSEIEFRLPPGIYYYHIWNGEKLTAKNKLEISYTFD
jgi:hypothetical protein